MVEGRLKIRVRDSGINLEPGEFVVIPRGVEHLPVAEEEVQVILLEPKSTVNTSKVHSERTALDQWI